MHAHEDAMRQRRGYLLVMWIAIGLCLFEIGGGIYSWSFVILIDAGHVFGDVIVYYFSALAILAKLKGTPAVELGNRNANIVITVASINIALSLARVLFFSDQTEVIASAMLPIASIGLGINVIMVMILLSLGLEHNHGGESCSHEHNHEHDEHDHHHDKPEKDWVHRVALIHIAGDVLISVFAVATALVIKFQLLGFNAELTDSMAAAIAGSFIILVTLREKRSMKLHKKTHES